MSRRWFGERNYFSLDINIPGPTEVIFDLELTAADIHDGNTISRILFAWYLQTDLVDNDSGLERAPWPFWVKADFDPDPDGDPTGIQPESVGGDALWREPVVWVPQSWTDGTLYATKWLGQSGQPRSGQAQRKINDKTTDKLRMAVGYDAGHPSFDGDTSWLPVSVKGYLSLEFLVIGAD